MTPLLEVIVTSVEEAREAERGGAGRLEVVRDLAHDGLTPGLDTVRAVCAAASIPVRAMLRATPAHEVRDARTLEALGRLAAALAALPIDGLVVGFVRAGRVDPEAMRTVLAQVPACRVTFHRAIETTDDPLAAIDDLRRLRRVDRVLWSGGSGDWPTRRTRLAEAARRGAPGIGVIVGGGLTREGLLVLRDGPGLREFHVGRAARVPPEPEGRVRAHAVEALVGALGQG